MEGVDAGVEQQQVGARHTPFPPLWAESEMHQPILSIGPGATAYRPPRPLELELMIWA